MNPIGPIPEVAVRSHRRLWTAGVVRVLLSLCPTVHSHQGGPPSIMRAGVAGGSTFAPFWLWIPAEILALALI